MALFQTVQLTDNFGEVIIFEDAYVKVTHVSSTKDFAVATYKFFKTQLGKELEERIIQFSLDLEGSNPIKQAYQFLKTLPEFSDAVDC
jgi:uncharacterized protein YecE (DUF72 family)